MNNKLILNIYNKLTLGLPDDTIIFRLLDTNPPWTVGLIRQELEKESEYSKELFEMLMTGLNILLVHDKKRGKNEI